MLKKAFLAVFLIGLLYTASCLYRGYRYFVPVETANNQSHLNSGGKSPATLPDKAVTGSYSEQVVNTASLITVELARYQEPLAPLVPVLFAPGLFLCRLVGFVPESLIPSWLLIALFSWEVWAVGLRLAWILPARYFGLGYSPRWFRYWLWLGIPWRPFFRFLRPAILWLRLLRTGTQDSDKFEGFFGRAFHSYRSGQIMLGRNHCAFLPALQPLGLSTERGATVIASVGSGKSSWLTALLADYPGNFLCVDADGGILNAIGHRLRKQGKTIIKLDPFGLAPDFPSATWNPIAELDQAAQLYGEEAVLEFAGVLSDGLLKKTEGVNEWVSADGRAFLKSLLVYNWKYSKPEHRNLNFVRTLLTIGEVEKARPQDDKFQVLLGAMTLKPDFNGAISAGAAMLRRSFSQKEGKSAPLSNAIQQTSYLDLPPMARASRQSSFGCLDLKRKKKCCLFLVLPLQAIQGQLSGWVRTLITMLTYVFQRDTQHRPKHQTLLALDECAHLHLDMRTALGGLRKFGLSTIAIFQSVSQMKAAYPESWHDYLGLSECNIWMTTNDQGTLDYLSNTLGTFTRVERVRGSWLSGIAARNQRENRKIASPGQVKLLLKNNVIVTRVAARPMVLKPIRHYIELPLTWLTPNRFYNENFGRACLRRCLNLLTGAVRRKALPTEAPSFPNTQERTI